MGLEINQCFIFRFSTILLTTLRTPLETPSLCLTSSPAGRLLMRTWATREAPTSPSSALEDSSLELSTLLETLALSSVTRHTGRALWLQSPCRYIIYLSNPVSVLKMNSIPGCLGIHQWRLGLVCHPLHSGHHHGSCLPGPVLCPRSPDADR